MQTSYLFIILFKKTPFKYTIHKHQKWKISTLRKYFLMYKILYRVLINVFSNKEQLKII
jgi:hypothetical protein